jgi:hypothetical protein
MPAWRFIIVLKSTPRIPILGHMKPAQTFLYVIKDKKLLHT